MKQYIIVRARNLESLEIGINEKMEKGYYPHGAMAAVDRVRVERPDCPPSYGAGYVQPMILDRDWLTILDKRIIG
jgi:hypothetical protein